MSDPNAVPIAGWYPDPENEAGDRWWNGATWSDHRRARNAGPGWAPAGAEPAQAAQAPAAAAAAAAPAAADPAIPVPPVPPVPQGSTLPANPYAGPAPGAPSYTGMPAAPYAPPYAPNYAPRTPMANAPALAGMITSLSAIFFNFIIFGLPGIIGGIISIIGLQKANRLAASGATSTGRTFAIVGIITGFLGAFLWNLFYFTTISPFQFS